MTTSQLQMQAFSEWNGSSGVRQQFPTFTHYWREKYGRVYCLDYRLTGAVLRMQCMARFGRNAGQSMA